MTEFEFHSLANLFPLMEGEDFEELVQDIRDNGLRDPIHLHEDKILDGRNRYRACVAASVEPRTKDFAGTDPLAFIVSKNLKRRHLTADQRKAVAADLAEQLADAAAARQKAGKTLGPNEPKGTAAAQAAKQLGISESSAKRGIKRKKNDPQAHEAAKRGEKSRRKLSEASKAARKTKPKFNLYEELNWLLANLPETFDTKAWVAGLEDFQRKNTADTVRRLRDRLAVLETALADAGGTDTVH